MVNQRCHQNRKKATADRCNFSFNLVSFSGLCSTLFVPKCPQLSSILVETYKTISPPKSSKLFSYLDPTHQNIMLEASLGILTFTLLSLASAPHISNSSPNTKQMKYAYTCSTICSSSQHHARRKYFIFFLSFFFFGIRKTYKSWQEKT